MAILTLTNPLPRGVAQANPANQQPVDQQAAPGPVPQDRPAPGPACPAVNQLPAASHQPASRKPPAASNLRARPRAHPKASPSQDRARP